MDWRVIFTELRVGVTIQLWIISLVCIGLAYLLIQGILYVKKRYKDIDQYRATVQHSVQIEYNKIATMKPEDLDNWLDKIFTSCIKMSIAAHYTPKDPIDLTVEIGISTGTERPDQWRNGICACTCRND